MMFIKITRPIFFLLFLGTCVFGGDFKWKNKKFWENEIDESSLHKFDVSDDISRSSKTCAQRSKLSKDQYCRCDKGQYVSRIVSEHNGNLEDRWFEITCSSVHKNGINLTYPEWRDYQTKDWTVEDSEFYLKAPKHHFLTGFQSEYVKDKRDRQFIFFFGEYRNFTESNRHFYYYPTENDWDKRLDTTPKAMYDKDFTIVGVWSKHSGFRKDRKYVFIQTRFDVE